MDPTQLHMRITPDFTLGEFIASDWAERRGIDNTPPPAALAALQGVLIPAMQAVRDILGVPFIVRSGYRCPELNRLVGGAPNSQHTLGQAADFVAPAFGTPRRVAAELVGRMRQVKFDQLIWEGSWVHVSFSSRPRNQVLTARFVDGRALYTQGLA